VTVKGKHIAFDTVYSIPKTSLGVELDNWFIFHFGRIRVDILSTCMLQIYCFARKDPDGEALSTLVDTLKDTLFDHTATDGLKKIPYYNESGVIVTGIVPLLDYIGEEELAADGTKFKMITVKLNWGTK
jgi:hypothetical protein